MALGWRELNAIADVSRSSQEYSARTLTRGWSDAHEYMALARTRRQ